MTKEIEVRHCRVLVAVAEEGGVAAAARALGLSQSTISETIASLERALDTRVIVRRSGVGVRLTASGEALLPHARAMIGTAEAARASVSPRFGQTLRIGTTESLSSYVFLLCWRNFAAHRQTSRSRSRPATVRCFGRW